MVKSTDSEPGCLGSTTMRFWHLLVVWSMGKISNLLDIYLSQFSHLYSEGNYILSFRTILGAQHVLDNS